MAWYNCIKMPNSHAQREAFHREEARRGKKFRRSWLGSLFRAEVRRRPHHHHRQPRHRHYRPRRQHYPGVSRPRRSSHVFAPIIFFGVPLILLFAIVASFLGVQPLASIKDKVVAAIADPFVVDEGEITAREHEVVDLVNALRAARGSEPLIWDDILYGYSKSHSEDMAKQGQLFHTPIGAPYGENAWGGESSGDDWSAKEIVDGWMTSPAHRTWLLCPHLKHIAVGIAKSDDGIYASWTFWIDETQENDWWYQYNLPQPGWWY